MMYPTITRIVNVITAWLGSDLALALVLIVLALFCLLFVLDGLRIHRPSR